MFRFVGPTYLKKIQEYSFNLRGKPFFSNIKIPHICKNITCY